MSSGSGSDEKRGYFRVDDIISVIAHPLDCDSCDEEMVKNLKSSKSFSLMDLEDQQRDESEDYGENGGDKRLWEMMKEIKTKLDFIINHFLLEKEGFTEKDRKLVNISASGIKFTTDYEAKAGDVMEIKLLLPTCPPVAVFAYGKVIRAKKVEDNKYEVAIEYLNMGDSVKNEIVQYTLDHQRDIIQAKKESKMNE